MSQSPTVFYVLHGDDEFSLKTEVRTMRARMQDPAVGDLNSTTLDGTKTPAGEVLAAVSAMPFLADKRLVVVEGMLTWLGRKNAGKSAKTELDTLVKGIPLLPETARLVFFELSRLADSHAVLKLALQEGMRGYTKEYSPPRDNYTQNIELAWLSKWITRRVEYYGGRIEPRAANALASVVNDKDLFAADRECDKLVLYAGSERAITEADVGSMTPFVPEANIFAIVESIALGRAGEALKLIQRLVDQQNQSPLSILSMINRQFRLLILVREAIDSGANPRDLTEIPRSSYAANKLIEQARRFSMTQLENVYRNLLDNDYAIKTGRVKDELALELFVAGLAN